MKPAAASPFLSLLLVSLAPGAAAQSDLGPGEPTTTAGFRGRPAAVYNQPAPPPAVAAGRYGGGLIELLVTGRDPTPFAARPPLRSAPPLPLGVGSAEPSFEPMPTARRPSPQLAALPGSPEADEGIGVRRVIDPKFRRQVVDYDGPHAPGTVVIHTPSKFLYHVQTGGRAVRYGIGVGRPGFEWAGLKAVTRKAEWPDWRPPEQMLRRRPDLPRFMAGGPENPLGARALYLGSSLYRIHGTNEPWSIGQAVSSGCIRMLNEDVIDLYGKVGVGTKVVVI